MAEKTTGSIISPTGEELLIPTVVLDHEDASLLRQYKKFLQKYHLAEALFCKECALASDISAAKRGQPHGCEAHVTDSQIFIKCRCKQRVYAGYTQ
jgi:hypothetical protein